MLLTVHDDIFPQIGTGRLSYDPSLYTTNPVFKAEASVSSGYTDISTIENWNIYGGETTLTTKQLRDEIDTLVVAKTFASCTDAEKDVASEWFVVDKSDRDTRHDASQQEVNAERLVRNLFPGFTERDIIACRDNIKDADKTIIDNIITAQSSPSLRMKTGSYTGDGTTSQPITGIGFKPQYVRIYEKEIVTNTAISMFETTAEIMDDNADGGAIVSATADPEHRFFANKIISLDDDGFTVDDSGADESPNKSSQLYNYWALG